jgi:uncharacterized protein YjiK
MQFLHFSNAVLCSLICLSLTLLSSCKSTASPSTPDSPFVQVASFKIDEVPEPSGIAWHSTRNTLFVVDDEGTVGEFDLQGGHLQSKKIGNYDLEGITHNPTSGLLYLAREGKEMILELQPSDLSVLRTFEIPRYFQDTLVMEEGNNGIEGITFVPDSTDSEGGAFWVAHQATSLSKKNEKSALFKVEIGLVSPNKTPLITAAIYPKHPDLSGLHYHALNNSFFVISDKKNQLMEYSLAGTLIAESYLLGSDQEGVTFNSQGSLFIAQDDGGVIQLQWKPDSLQ